MKVRVLGCSGAIARDCRTTSFLIDDRILVDAGTGVGDLSLNEMKAIDHVLLTHSHLDHIAALPLMLDSVSGLRSRPVEVHALPQTIHALKQHIFNNVIWPDFSVIPNCEAPFVRFSPIATGDVLTIEAIDIEVLPAVHTVPAVGYALRGDSGWWVFSGDTERNPAFWERVNALPVAMLVIETAFSNRERELARRSLHLCPDSLLEELALFKHAITCSIYITHTKPSETGAIVGEIRSCGADFDGRIEWLCAGQHFDI